MDDASLPSKDEVLDATVSGVHDFGAFVDLKGGLHGLIHISDLSWGHVNHPEEVVAIGDELVVKVLDVDRRRRRISVGLKQMSGNPWEDFAESHGPGEVLVGEVSAVRSFGAFVRLAPFVEGLLPLDKEDPRTRAVREGARVRVLICELDRDRRRLALAFAP